MSATLADASGDVQKILHQLVDFWQATVQTCGMGQMLLLTSERCVDLLRVSSACC